MSEGSFLEKNFLKYSVIFTEGSRGDSAYLLKEGRVEISKGVDNKKKVFALLKPISLFGEMAILLEDERRTATAVALEDSKVVEIKKEDFHRLVEQSPPVISTVVKVLVHRLKSATQKSLRVPNLYLAALYTLDMLAKHGVEQIDHLTLTNNMAQTLVTTPESIDKILATIAADSMITFDKADSGAKVVRLLETDDFVGKALDRRKKAAAGGG
jgi:CRP-like cAMP-binding protein